MDVINQGFSGYNSQYFHIDLPYIFLKSDQLFVHHRDGAKIFFDAVISKKPQFLTIFFGANDAVMVPVI